MPPLTQLPTFSANHKHSAQTGLLHRAYRRHIHGRVMPHGNGLRGVRRSPEEGKRHPTCNRHPFHELSGTEFHPSSANHMSPILNHKTGSAIQLLAATCFRHSGSWGHLGSLVTGAPFSRNGAGHWPPMAPHGPPWPPMAPHGPCTL